MSEHSCIHTSRKPLIRQSAQYWTRRRLHGIGMVTVGNTSGYPEPFADTQFRTLLFHLLDCRRMVRYLSQLVYVAIYGSKACQTLYAFPHDI